MERRAHGESVHFARAQVDRHALLRERMVGFRGRLLPMAGVLVAPFVITGYLGLAALLVLPLVGLRRVFRRRPKASILRPDGDAPRYLGVGNLSGAAPAPA